jgi:hypothetical protein
MKNYSAFFGLLFLFFYSCTYEKAEPVSECASLGNVSFSKHIQPIFDAHCNTGGCHSGTTPKGNLNLEASVSYAQLWRTKSGYIDTLNPALSVLYASMNSTSNPMPPSGKLDKCAVNLVLTWIKQKAKNN